MQYFSLEMHYIQKLRGRRELLKLDQGKNKDQDDVEDGEDSGDEDEGEGIEAMYEHAKLPRVVYRNAIKAIPDDVAFRLRFIDCCTRFPKTQVVEKEIMDSVRNDSLPHHHQQQLPPLHQHHRYRTCYTPSPRKSHPKQCILTPSHTPQRRYTPTL